MSHPDPASRRTPLYRQLEKEFRAAVAEGRWPVGERIPTELELARRYRVARATVREALRQLVADGLVVRRPGDGSYPVRLSVRRGLAPWFSLTAELGHRGRATSVQVVENRLRRDPRVAQILGLAPNARVRRILRVHTLGGRFAACEAVSLAPGLARRPSAAALRGSLHSWLAEEGLVPRRATLEVREGDAEEVPAALRRAGPPPSGALVRVERLSFLGDGRPLMHIVFWYAAELEDRLEEHGEAQG